VDIHLHQTLRTRIDELVRHACRDNHDLPCLCFKGGRTNRIGRTASLNDKDLFIRVSMQLWAFSWRQIHQYQRYGGVSMPVSLQLIGVPKAREFISLHDEILHVCLLCILVVMHCHSLFSLHDLQYLEPFLPGRVQVSFDADAIVHSLHAHATSFSYFHQKHTLLLDL